MRLTNLRGVSESSRAHYEAGLLSNTAVTQLPGESRSFCNNSKTLTWQLHNNVTYVGPFGGYMSVRQSSVYCKHTKVTAVNKRERRSLSLMVQTSLKTMQSDNSRALITQRVSVVREILLTGGTNCVHTTQNEAAKTRSTPGPISEDLPQTAF